MLILYQAVTTNIIKWTFYQTSNLFIKHTGPKTGYSFACKCPSNSNVLSHQKAHYWIKLWSWWWYDIIMLSTLLATCDGKPLVTGRFLSQSTNSISCFLCCWLEQKVQSTVELPLIWDTRTLIWCNCDVHNCMEVSLNIRDSVNYYRNNWNCWWDLSTFSST